MKNQFPRFAFLMLTVFAMTPAIGATELPQKAFNIEGGMIALRSGVMPNILEPMPPPIGNFKYPIRYFIEINNESPYPVWVDAAWAFPEAKKNKPTKIQTFRSTKIPAHGSYLIHHDKFGVLVDQPIGVELKVYADEKRTRLVGSQPTDLNFDKQSIDRFLANFPSAFKNQSDEAREAALISGWRDIPPSRTDVPGTLADAELQRDIQLNIWKVDSSRRWTCDREVVAAARLDVVDSLIVALMPEEAQLNARTEQAENTLFAETWTVRSCGQERVYEVLLSATLSGGTDILVFDTAEEQSMPEMPPALN